MKSNSNLDIFLEDSNFFLRSIQRTKNFLTATDFVALNVRGTIIFILALLSLLQATLTLPGIAGIVLTMGMAVDANVLIFERIKEELKDEKNNILAFDSGYIKSRTAIIDANITTLLAAIILFFMGSGPIKGFSVTLGIGIFTTLFSVYFIARLFTSLYVSKNRNKEKLI